LFCFQLPFLKQETDIFEWHLQRIQNATEKLNSLAYVPNVSNNKDAGRKSAVLPQALQQQHLPGTVSLL